MSYSKETFFTRVGCMDGRCQKVVAVYGRRLFGAEYPDTITDAGIVGLLAENPPDELLTSLKKKLYISSEKHKSKGILVYGHTDCAGDSVDDDTQKQHIQKATTLIKKLVDSSIPVYGVFVKRNNTNSREWMVEELTTKSN